ncbi:AGAP004848-PA [Anopheles gambiae str. PEST]|uniref:AGAP004848-PA n=1 Tax=Anopheles gambiae TaxID=7165 RepID=Q7Q951_ANOGA|nr:AGAP004848-PA [Anopheles gambiae str. PEST]
MLSERKQPYYPSSAGDINGSVPPMKEAAFDEWSKHRLPQHSYSITDGSEKLADLKMGASKSPAVAVLAALKGTFLNIVSWSAGQLSVLNGTKPEAHVSQTMVEKEEQAKKVTNASSSCIPIFETTSNGKGQLTVPLDYSSTVDDISMTPAGVYFEETARSDRNASRPGRRKRRKDTSKSNQNVHAGSEGGSSKGCGKNRKDKKRHALRRDILSDNLALSMDDSCYGYDFREAVYSNPVMETHSLPQRCLSSSFSPSSTGSIGSFHDALQDIVPTDNMHLHASSDSMTAASALSVNGWYQNVPAKQALTVAPDSVDRIGEQSKLKCDIEHNNHNEYVVFSDYDVFTTPSASPARRRPPRRNFCPALSFVLHHQHSDDSQEENNDEEEDGKSDYTSEDISDDEGTDGADGLEYDDDDDDSIVFCEDYDALNDDSNSSSGFEEKKVRFNSKPVVHVMRAWDFAYRQARKGEWEMAARDRERFRKRIAELEPLLGPALQPALRDKVYSERFSGEESTRKILN